MNQVKRSIATAQGFLQAAIHNLQKIILKKENHQIQDIYHQSFAGSVLLMGHLLQEGTILCILNQVKEGPVPTDGPSLLYLKMRWAQN